MSRTVVVLCPNARREVVKVTPNSSILQVLEEACKKQNLNPEDYDLRHSNRTLDLSLPIRFSNLPNNVQVELRPAENARKDSVVTVCVQLESGERLTADFSPSATLYDVVEQCLKSDSIAIQDVGELACIYMRQRISGDSIKTTTLRSLGLTKGQAIIRLLYRKPEELQQQAHVSSPLVSNPIQENAMGWHAQPDSPLPSDSSSESFKPIEIQMDSAKEKELPPFEISYWEPMPPVKKEKTAIKDEALPPKESSNWGSAPTQDERTVVMGETGPPTGYSNWDSAPTRNERTVGTGETLPPKEYSNWGSAPTRNEETVGTSKTSPPKEFSNWDSVPIKEDNLPQTGEVKMECDVESPEDTFQGVGDIKYIGERHAVLYSLDHITDVKKADLPDEFFDLTVNDVRYLMEEYRRERTALENQPLQTKEQRQRNILQKLAQFDQTVIRIYFPERLVLQAVFSSTETAQTISDFIRNYLEDKNLKFYLYKTPPKEILNQSKTLLETMLVPAAVIYFGCESQRPNYLDPSLRDQLSDPRAASLAASEARKEKSITTNDLPSENVIKEEKILEDANPVVNTISHSEMNHSERNQNPGKVPKWLKLSRK